MRRRTTVALAALLLAGSVGLPAANERAMLPAAEVQAAGGYQCEFLGLINRFRKKHGKPELTLSSTLNDAAVNHSEDMAANNYFGHTLKGPNPNVSWDRNIQRSGYKGSPIGENIAAGAESATATMRMWVKSKPHRKNMLNGEFRAIGVGRGYDKGSKYGWYWTTTFGGDRESAVAC